MSVSIKIGALLKLKGKKNVELAKKLGISYQALMNKFNRDSYSVLDLVKISSFLECDLAFVIDDKQKIVITEDDIKKEKTESGR